MRMGKKIKVHRSVKKNLMKEKHDKALEAFIKVKGNITAQTLATQVNTKKSTVQKWMEEEDWEAKYYERIDLSSDTVELIATAGEDFGLDEQEEMFAYHYMRTFNARASALHAGYSPKEADYKGRSLLRTPAIRRFISTVKQQMAMESFLVSSDIIEMYERIAFADIKDFVEIDKYGNPKLKQDIDGQLVKSVKKGKDGVTFELIDKKWAMDKLDQIHKATPNEIAQETLKLQSARVEIERAKLGDDGNTQLVDGFEDAFKGSIQKIWKTNMVEDGDDDAESGGES